MFLMGLLPCGLALGGIIGVYETQAVKQNMMEAQNNCDILTDQISIHGYLSEPENAALESSLSQVSNFYDARILIVNEDFKIIKDTYSVSDGKTLLSEEVFQCFDGKTFSNYNSEERYIEIVSPIKTKDSKKVIGALLLNASTDKISANMQVLSERAELFVFVAGVAVLAIALGICLFMFRPFKRISTALERMAEGHPEDGLEVLTYTETAEISNAFNRVWNRMKVLDESRQEFVSNVSHELKTPITSIKVLADSLIAQEDASVELYKEFMADIAEEIDRESKIINDLLSLVKMDKTAADLNIASCDINGLVESILKRLRPIAAERNIELVFESFRPVSAEIDEMKLSLAISNLVENAIKYNHDNGWVHVSLNADHKYFFIKVEDSGIGIPEEDVEYIFERFYRVDKSHSREIGGTGLGLAITRSAVIMHRGAIKVYSQENEGTTFTVRIPLNYIA